MWRGYEEALGRYGLAACEAWVARGFGDSCAETITADLSAAGVSPIRSYADLHAAGALPSWLFDPAVQRSHQSALVRKDPDHYRSQFPDVPADLDYVRWAENARRGASRRAVERTASPRSGGGRRGDGGTKSAEG